MSKETEFPKFHSKGSPRGDFYVLAFVRGLYVPPSEKTQDDAFLVLNYSPSKDFTRFSFAIDSLDDRLHAYRRGNENPGTVESALLEAWYHYEVPPHFWSLYPRNKIGRAAFGNKRIHPKQYWEARARLCLALAGCRHAAWFKTEECAAQIEFDKPLRPLFRFKETPRVPNAMEANGENEEIFEAVMKLSSLRD